MKKILVFLITSLVLGFFIMKFSSANTVNLVHNKHIVPNDQSYSVEAISESQVNSMFDISTLIGGNNTDYGYALELDSQKNLILTGSTSSADFPAFNAFNDTHGGMLDAFVMKTSPNGTILWSTFIGGSNDENSYDITLDSEDNIYITGYSDSYDFPTFNSINNTQNGISDVFLTKLAKNGSLVWNMLIGGTADDIGTAVKINTKDEVIVVGHTQSTDFPISNAYEQDYQGGFYDIFVMKISEDGSLIWSTYIGGSETDYCRDVGVDDQGAILITGQTNSYNFPVLNAFNPTHIENGGAWDGYATKISDTGSLLWSTFIGGGHTDGGRAIGIDSSNNVIIVGYTHSNDFPLLNAFDGQYNGQLREGFFLIMTESGDLVSSSYIGGSGNDNCHNVALDSNDNLIIVGTSRSLDFPLNKAYFPEKSDTTNDIVVSKFHINGSMQWSTYIGGALDHDIGQGIIIDNDSNIVITGYTDSTDFPVTDNTTITIRNVFLLKMFDPDLDIDLDTLSNYQEFLLGLNLKSNDTDNDSMSDGWEIEMGLNATLNDANLDQDNDSLSNLVEYIQNTFPTDPDTDNDLMPDGWEIEMGLNATFNDATLDKDRDGMSNVWEYQMSLNASNSNDAIQDQDNDDLSNFQEYQLGLNAKNKDTDNDGMPDGWEVSFLLNASSDDSDNDLDDDEITNLQEYNLGTSPNNNDTDNDGMPDGWEVFFTLNPLINDANADKDADGLSNLEEYVAGTSPINTDTDGDGFSDGLEKNLGADPLSRISNPLTHLLLLIMVLSLFAGLSILPVNAIYQRRKKKILRKSLSTAPPPINLSEIAKKHKMPLAEVIDLIEIEGEVNDDFHFLPAAFIVAEYQAPDYATVKLVKAGNFPDYKTYLQAQDFGATTMKQLELVQRLQAPDFATAKLIKSGNFPDYDTFKKAQKLGVEKLEQLKLIEKYQTEDYRSAVKQYRQDILEDLITTLRKDGKVVFTSFLKKYTGLELSTSDTLKMIKKENIQGIPSKDQEIFLTSKFIRERLIEASKIYADLEFEAVATSLEIPVEYVHEILVAAIKNNTILGMVDRTNKRLFIREIPVSLLEQMIGGQMASVKQIKEEYSQSLEASLNILQEQLPSPQYVLIREKKFFRIEQIKCGCQICSDTVLAEKFLKCVECNRELCWDHFIELGAVGRSVCPYCDGSLIFLPQYCDKCHIDSIRVPRHRSFCDHCGYPLKVKDNLISFQQNFLEAKTQTIAKAEDEFAKEVKKKKN